MGLFDMFKQGTKDAIKGYDKVKLNKKLNYEELYDIMKAGTYPCGEPFLTGKGIMHCIQFPPVDKYLIQISISGTTVTIAKIYSGVGGILKESVGDAVTGGWYDVLNGENVDLNQMTRIIGEEVTRLCQGKGLIN
jgi:hypothetical protein